MRRGSIARVASGPAGAQHLHDLALLRRGDLTVTEVVQEPTDQDWGARDCAFRDPAGNMVRLQQAS